MHRSRFLLILPFAVIALLLLAMIQVTADESSVEITPTPYIAARLPLILHLADYLPGTPSPTPLVTATMTLTPPPLATMTPYITITPSPSSTATETPTVTATSTETATPTETAVPATPTQTPQPTPSPTSNPPEEGSELLVFDWNKPVETWHHGFPRDTPPMESANGDWTQPVNFAEGTLYFRAEVRSQPVSQDMLLQFCFWQYNHTLENCGRKKQVLGDPGFVQTWSTGVQDMWMKDQLPIDWANPRDRNGVAIKNSLGLPVSDLSGWNWNGEVSGRMVSIRHALYGCCRGAGV